MCIRDSYTTNPRVILSHPQIYKKADYYVSKIANENYVKVNDVFVNDAKEIFICGKTKDSFGYTIGFLAKLSATGVKDWEKTLKSTDGQQEVEFERILIDGQDIYVAGHNKPNASILEAYNPDVVLCKYTQAENGLSATLQYQKAYAGISGSTRSDNISAIAKYSDTRFVLGGFTNTNSGNPFDAYIAVVDTLGNFAVKRKITSVNVSEKVTDLLVNGTDIYYTLEIATSPNATSIDTGIGKATVGTSAITLVWTKQLTNTLYSFMDTSLTVDEFSELYLTATTRLKSDNTTKDGFWIGKLDSDGAFLWNYRYAVAGGYTVNVAKRTHIDIFGDLNVAVNKYQNTDCYVQ